MGSIFWTEHHPRKRGGRGLTWGELRGLVLEFRRRTAQFDSWNGPFGVSVGTGSQVPSTKLLKSLAIPALVWMSTATARLISSGERGAQERYSFRSTECRYSRRRHLKLFFAGVPFQITVWDPGASELERRFNWRDILGRHRRHHYVRLQRYDDQRSSEAELNPSGRSELQDPACSRKS